MADQKVSDLTSVASVGGDEIMYLVDDPSGTPLDRKVAVDTLLARAAAVLSGTFQPLDADLTALAALVTTAYGRGLLTDADAAAFTTRLTGLLNGTYVALTDYEDADVLAKIKNVDGSGSGLDADLLDGHDTSYFETPAGAQAKADAKVTQVITNGVTATAPSEDAVFDALALKAPLASPAFTGDPTAPTPSTSDSDTSIATTAHVHAVADAKVSDTAYNATTWDAVTDVAPSKNAVRDKTEALDAAKIDKTTLDANSVLYATADDTPAALAMGASTILARLAAGNIVAATPAELRTLLALVVGTNVQAWDADLDAIAALTSAANKLPYSTGAQAWALADLTAFARTLLDDADATAMQTTLGLLIGTNVAQLGAAPFSMPWQSGRYYWLPNFGNITTGTLTTSAERAVPFWVPNSSTLIRIGVDVSGAGDAGTSFSDGVTTNGSTTITSATANFVSGHVGRKVSGTGIPANTYIVSRVNSTTITISNAATATNTGVTVTMSGAVVRLGLRADDGTGRPSSTVLLDAGTIDGSSNTVQEITISQALSPGLYWAVAVTQGVVTTQPTLRLVSANGIVPNIDAGTSTPSAAAQGVGRTTFSVTSALGAWSDAGTPTTTIPRIFGKVS